jgi:hypothetical protein
MNTEKRNEVLSEKERLHKDLIKLGDMMADGLHYEDPSIAREYRKIAKQLYPEMYPTKKRKPSKSIIMTLKKCNCGAEGWRFVRFGNGNVGFKCTFCDMDTGECKSNSEARDKWNSLFDEAKP